MSADNTPAVAAPLVLGYGDIAVQRGVTVARDGAALRIRVPPPRIWSIREVKLAWLFVFLQAGFASLGQISKGNYGTGIAIILVEAAVLVFFVACFAARRRSSRSGTIFELTADTLHLSADKPASGLLVTEGESRWIATRPRHAITEIRYNPYDRSLLVRVPGHNLILGLLSKEDRRLIEYVATTLTTELASGAPKLPS